MKQYRGDFFVVPNVSRAMRARNMEHMQDCGDCIATQVWVADPIEARGEDGYCENWPDHRGPVNLGYIPTRLLTNVREGDTIELKCIDRNGEPCLVELTAKQADYRYRKLGSFEAVLRQTLQFSSNVEFYGWIDGCTRLEELSAELEAIKKALG